MFVSSETHELCCKTDVEYNRMWCFLQFSTSMDKTEIKASEIISMRPQLSFMIAKLLAFYNNKMLGFLYTKKHYF